VSERVLQVVRYVRNPLGFFALALLLLYLFLLAAGAVFNVGEAVRVALIVVGVVAFVLVIASVVWLTARHPTGLVFGEETQLRYQQLIYGSNEDPLPRPVLEAMPKGPSTPALPGGE